MQVMWGNLCWHGLNFIPWGYSHWRDGAAPCTPHLWSHRPAKPAGSHSAAWMSWSPWCHCTAERHLQDKVTDKDVRIKTGCTRLTFYTLVLWNIHLPVALSSWSFLKNPSSFPQPDSQSPSSGFLSPLWSSLQSLSQPWDTATHTQITTLTLSAPSCSTCTRVAVLLVLLLFLSQFLRHDIVGGPQVL